VNNEALTRWGLSCQKLKSGGCFEGQNKPQIVDTSAETRIALFLNTNTKNYNLAVGCEAEQFSTQVQHQLIGEICCVNFFFFTFYTFTVNIDQRV
jgi:hypothetical protein